VSKLSGRLAFVAIDNHPPFASSKSLFFSLKNVRLNKVSGIDGRAMSAGNHAL
jgi:hypothetical protein